MSNTITPAKTPSVSVATIAERLPPFRRILPGLRHAVMTGLAAITAYVPTHELALQQGFWSCITAIAVVQTEFHLTESSARNQFTGALIGGLIGLCAVLAFGAHLPVYIIAVMLAVLTCWVLNVISASQLGGITVTIVMLVPHTGSPAGMMISRLSEVAWGVTVGITIVWLAAYLTPRRFRKAG